MIIRLCCKCNKVIKKAIKSKYEHRNRLKFSHNILSYSWSYFLIVFFCWHSYTDSFSFLTPFALRQGTRNPLLYQLSLFILDRTFIVLANKWYGPDENVVIQVISARVSKSSYRSVVINIWSLFLQLKSTLLSVHLIWYGPYRSHRETSTQCMHVFNSYSYLFTGTKGKLYTSVLLLQWYVWYNNVRSVICGLLYRWCMIIVSRLDITGLSVCWQAYESSWVGRRITGHKSNPCWEGFQSSRLG